MLSVLKLSLPLYNQSIDLKTLQEGNWGKMTEEQKVDIYKFNIDITGDNVNQWKEILPVVLSRF